MFLLPFAWRSFTEAPILKTPFAANMFNAAVRFKENPNSSPFICHAIKATLFLQAIFEINIATFTLKMIKTP